MADNVDHDAVTSQFMELTGANSGQATQYLSASAWNLETAAAAYFADLEEGPDESAAGSTSQRESTDYSGPRTLDGRPAPQSAIPTYSSSSKPQKKTGLATLSSLGGGSGGGGHAHDHDSYDSEDEDDDDPRGPRDTYAGGEKSGLAVQDPSQRSSDPRKLINDILAKAKANSSRPEADQEAGPSRPSAFHGGGQTLGGEGVQSRVIPDPRGSASTRQAQNQEPQERVLHLWSDGFSIDDGELRRFDDPANAQDLRLIQSGRAPLHLMNVSYDQPVDVKLQQHDENYRPLPKKYKPFGGEGRRLGSPVPGESGVAAAPALATSNTAAAAPSTSAPAASSVDESQPLVMIRIQMPDGTRLPARFNTTQTVNDVYDFIVRASPELRAGGWVLATTFPNKDHTDKALVLGDMAEFKKGGTAMVKRT